MVLTIVVILFGLLIGRLRGGRLRNLSDWHVNSWRVLLAAVGAWVALELFGADDVWLAAAAILGAMWFGFRNLHLTGMPIVLIGLGLNLVPIVLNGHIPTRVDSLLVADVTTREDLARLDLSGGRQFESSDDLLPQLGDIVPIPITQQVLSFGDLIALAGLATIAANAMQTRHVKGSGKKDDADDHDRPATEPKRRKVRPEDVEFDIDKLILDLTGQAPKPTDDAVPPLPREVPAGGDLPRRERSPVTAADEDAATDDDGADTEADADLTNA